MARSTSRRLVRGFVFAALTALVGCTTAAGERTLLGYAVYGSENTPAEKEANRKRIEQFRTENGLPIGPDGIY